MGTLDTGEHPMGDEQQKTVGRFGDGYKTGVPLMYGLSAA